MKIKVVLSVMMLVMSLYDCSLNAAQRREDRYDSRWFFITDAEMKKQVRAKAHDTTALYQLWWRAVYQQKQEPYFSTLRKIKQEQPKNGAVLSAYCAVLMKSNATYGFGQFKFRVDGHEGDVKSIRVNLEKAKLLAPNLWLNAVTESYLAFFSETGTDMERAENAVALCRRAFRLAPKISYANAELGYALSNLSMRKKTRYAESIRYYKQSQQLLPVNVGASFLLLDIYRFDEPDKAEVEKTIKAILSTIPPSVKLSVRQKQFLVKQGVVTP